MTAASGDHRRQGGVGAVNHAEIIYAHDFFDGVYRSFGKRFAHADAGVVDEDVNLAEVGENPATIDWTSCRLPTSQGIIVEEGLARRTSVKVRCPSRSCERPQPMTTAPRLAKSIARHRPMPLDAPVMRTT